MKLARIVGVTVLAAAAGIIAATGAAEAGSRWRLHFLNPYYYLYDPPPLDLYSSDYGDDEYYDENGDPLSYYNPDDGYYEPRYRGDEPLYVAPRKKKTAKAIPVPKPETGKSLASAESNTVTITEKKAAPATAGMSCDKAEKIVSGYGFTSVKPTTCTGQVFAFNATRSGKAFVIKLSSTSGELTEVKKVQ